MILRKLYDNLQDKQSPYLWLNSISNLEKINLDFKDWRFLFILETLKIWKALWFKIFKESNKEISKQEIKNLLAWAKSYHSNKSIASSKLKFIIEWLAYEFKDLNLKFNLTSLILDKKLKINDFLKQVEKIEEDSKIEWNNKIDKQKNFTKDFIFIGKSGKTYSWIWMQQLRKYKEVDVLDIIEWYSWENETLKKVIPYLLNNKDELKNEFKQYRQVIISALSVLFWLESKAVNYILAKLENEETNETQTISSIVPF